MTSPHLPAARLGNKTSAERAAEERAYRFDEADFLLSCGTAPNQIAQQLGCTLPALERQAYRWGRRDLAVALASIERGSCIDCHEPNHPRRTRCIQCHNRNHIPARRNQRTLEVAA